MIWHAVRFVLTLGWVFIVLNAFLAHVGLGFYEPSDRTLFFIFGVALLEAIMDAMGAFAAVLYDIALRQHRKLIEQLRARRRVPPRRIP